MAISRSAGTDVGAVFPGGPEHMTREAEKQGLNAKSYDGITDMTALDGELDSGHSVILNGPNHFINIAAKTGDGRYIVGDPAAPDVPVMTHQDIQSRLVNAGRGFTAVWNDGMVVSRQFANIPPAARAAAPVAYRGDPSSNNFTPVANASNPGGGNSSMFEGGPMRGSKVTPSGIPQPDHHFESAPNTAPQSVGTRTQSEEDFYTSNPSFDASLTNKVVHAIGGNEGQSDSVNWDDAGYGISIGMRQWNQKAGEMPEFMRSMYEKLGEDRFKELYPELFKRIKEMGMNWESLRDLEFKPDNALGLEMQKALKDEQVKQFQLDAARQWVVDTMKQGYEAGFKSEYRLASVADAINQAGPGSVGKTLNDLQLQQALKSKDEKSAVARM